MKLCEAELIAVHPDLMAFSREDIAEALARLQTPRVTARMRNVSDRTYERWQRRVTRLQTELGSRP